MLNNGLPFMVDMSYQAALSFRVVPLRICQSFKMMNQVKQAGFIALALPLALSSLVLPSGSAQANSVPVLEVQNQVARIGKELSFLVAPIDFDGATPNVFVRSGPEGAVLVDNGDGTRTYSWLPKETGDYTVNFIVQDGSNASVARQYDYNIKVVGAGATSVAIQTIGTRVNTSSTAALGSTVTVTAEPDVSATAEPASAVNEIPSSVEIPSNTIVASQATQATQAVEAAGLTPSESITTDVVTETSRGPSSQTIFLNGQVGSVTKILADLPVSTSQTNVQQSSIDTSGRYLYTANIEPGPNGDSTGVPLRTVLRQGYQRGDNSWEWKSVIIDDRTLHNRWHTAPSVAIDKTGSIHVAYNMHNFPWQYKKSDNPHDITSMVFKGQQITDAELKLAEDNNRTRFPTLGSAAIPGNQITYPAFHKDRNDDLYVSYRFAAAPKRDFSDRAMSTGIAVYDTDRLAWSSIGAKFNHNDGDFDASAGSPNEAMPFAGKKGWTSYLPRVVFSKQNDIIVSMFWRDGIAGRQVSMPCVVRSIGRNDVVDMKGGSISLPVQPEQCGNIGIDNNQTFYTIGSFAIDNEDSPYLLLSPTEGSRFITRYSAAQQRWIEEKAPEGATEIFFDNDNNMYAVASGISVFKRASVGAEWQKIYSENGVKNCYPKVKKDVLGKNAFIHTQSCDEKHITIYGLRLQ